MYMNGRDIMKTTERLEAELWEALDRALIGAVYTGCAMPFFLLAMISTPPLAPLIFLFIGLALAVPAYRYQRPWYIARRALIEHREAMEAETAKRGKGWAQS